MSDFDGATDNTLDITTGFATADIAVGPQLDTNGAVVVEPVTLEY